MRTKLSFAVLAVVLLTVGCFNQNACFTQTQGPTPVPTATPSPTPTPSPSASPSPGANVIRTVEVNGFGEQGCPAGVTPSCTDGSSCRTLRLRCQRAYTCTSRTASGQDGAAVIPGLQPSLFDAVTGKGTVTTIERDPNNPGWNLFATATAVGSFRLECTVQGVSTDPAQPFVITVVP